MISSTGDLVLGAGFKKTPRSKRCWQRGLNSCPSLVRRACQWEAKMLTTAPCQRKDDFSLSILNNTTLWKARICLIRFVERLATSGNDFTLTKQIGNRGTGFCSSVLPDLELLGHLIAQEHSQDGLQIHAVVQNRTSSAHGRRWNTTPASLSAGIRTTFAGHLAAFLSPLAMRK